MTKIHLTDGQTITTTADFDEVVKGFNTSRWLRPQFLLIEASEKKILLNYDCVVFVEGD